MTQAGDHPPGSRSNVPRVAGRALLAYAVLAAVAGLAIALAPADARPSVTRLAFLTIGVAAAWPLLRRSATVTSSTPERFEAELRQPEVVPDEIAGLRSADLVVRMATGSSFGVEFMLKPLLRDLARWRLMRSRGIDMDATPDLARQTVGEELWSKIQPGEPRPVFGARGIALTEIQQSLDQLERI